MISESQSDEYTDESSGSSGNSDNTGEDEVTQDLSELLPHDPSSDGFMICKPIYMRSECNCDYDTCEIESEENPNTSSWKDKNGTIKHAVNSENVNIYVKTTSCKQRKSFVSGR